MSLVNHLFKFSDEACRASLQYTMENNRGEYNITEQSTLNIYVMIMGREANALSVHQVIILDGKIVKNDKGRGTYADFVDHCVPILDPKELTFARALFI